MWDQIWLTVPFWSKRTDQSQFDLNVISILIWSPEFKGNKNEICRVKNNQNCRNFGGTVRACRTPPCAARSRPREHVVLWEQDEGTTGKRAENVGKIIWIEMKTWGLLISEMPFSRENHVPPDLVIFQVKGRTKCSLLLRASYVSTEDPDFQVRLESDCPHVQWRNLLVSFPPPGLQCQWCGTESTILAQCLDVSRLN